MSPESEPLRPAAARIVRAFAALDLVATLPLAIPGVAYGYVGLLYRMDARLGGAAAQPALDGLLVFLLHLAGALGVLWALVRLALPSRILGLADAAGRTWVAMMIAHSVAGYGAPRVLLLFVATELAGAVAQAWVLRQRASR